MNDYAKHRESFRPFAISVPEEDFNRYFDCSPAGRFMATLGFARPEANPLFWIAKTIWRELAGTFPVNTSFNLFGDPLVITLRQAVSTYLCSGADPLIVGDFLLSK